MWRSVTTGTTFLFEDSLSFRGLGTELIRILWRCERIQIQRQRVQLFVGIPRGSACRRFRLSFAIPCKAECVLYEGGIAHQVADVPMKYESRMVQESPVLHANQVGNLRRQ